VYTHRYLYTFTHICLYTFRMLAVVAGEYIAGTGDGKEQGQGILGT
jgi:hypothetical protein